MWDFERGREKRGCFKVIVGINRDGNDKMKWVKELNMC